MSSHQPTIDPMPGNELAQKSSSKIANYNFTQVLDCNFGRIVRFNNQPFAESVDADRLDQPNSADRPRSIGLFDVDGKGKMKNVFKVEPLTDGVYATQHRRGIAGDFAPTPEDGRRDHAWYNKAYSRTFVNRGDHVQQRGAVIGTNNNDYHNYNGDSVNLCTSWIDTFSISRELPFNAGINIPNPETPNVTFGKNTFFEIEVNFSKMKTPGFRHSWWLLPATINDRPADPVIFRDNARRDVNGKPRVLDRTAYDGPGRNARNGVEIDIYEHVVGNGGTADETMLMKVITSDRGDNTKNAFGTSTNVVSPGINSGWHRIGFLWSETELVWFIDGKAVVRDAANMPNDVRMYMLLTRELNSILFGGNPRINTNRQQITSDAVGMRYIRVWSVDEIGGNARKREIAAPTGVVAVSTESLVQLSWNMVAGANKYNVLRSVNGGIFVYSTTTSRTQFKDRDVTPGSRYSYHVVAIRDPDNVVTHGEIFSVKSADISIVAPH